MISNDFLLGLVAGLVLAARLYLILWWRTRSRRRRIRHPTEPDGPPPTTQSRWARSLRCPQDRRSLRRA